MKKILALLLIVCLLLPMAALAEEKLPRLEFPAKNYVAYSGYEFSLRMDVKSKGSLKETKTLELRDETGLVWATKEFRPGFSSQTCTFKAPLEVSHEGGHTLSVWCGDTQVSKNTTYVAVTDKHRKAIQTVETDQPYMSLSFDCAYYGAPTDELLAILDELNIKATFFMTGEFVENFLEEAKKIRDAGHEIASHSYSHPHMKEISLDRRFSQLKRGLETIVDNLGVVPRLFRPPFGEFDVTVSAPARALGMEVCMWTIDSHDWDEDYSKAGVIRRVTKDVGPGTIILFHLDGFYTREILPEVVAYYREELGLEFVTISELLAIGGRELPASPYLED